MIIFNNKKNGLISMNSIISIELIVNSNKKVRFSIGFNCKLSIGHIANATLK